jgi:hypothetical protein
MVTVRANEWRKSLDAVPALLPAAPAGALVANRCLVSGALDRQANDRVAIRAAPRPDARVLWTIPSFRLEGGERIAPQFSVIGARAGWLLIHDVGFDGYDAPARRLLVGSGWIEARRMRVEIESFRLHRDPDPGSPLAADMTPSSPEAEARLTTVHGCSGSMLDLTMRLADGRTRRAFGRHTHDEFGIVLIDRGAQVSANRPTLRITGHPTSAVRSAGARGFARRRCGPRSRSGCRSAGRPRGRGSGRRKVCDAA